MPNLSRRHLVTTAAALPALAMPAIADPSGPNPDAELLRLGVELEAVIVEWHAQRAIDKGERSEWEAACVAAGLPQIEFGTIPDDEWRAYQDKRNAITSEMSWSSDDTNDYGESIAWNEISDRQFPLIEDIFEQRPHTVAGLAVVARAITLYWAERWEPISEFTGYDRAFMEMVCAFAGVVPVPAEAVRS
jgi:hypothetical protein